MTNTHFKEGEYITPLIMAEAGKRSIIKKIGDKGGHAIWRNIGFGRGR